MIYIFSGFQNLCSLPGYCCQGIGTLCKSCPGACQVISDPFRKCCTNCGSTTKQFFEMPLSVYVLVSFVVSAYVAFKAQGNMKKDGEACTSTFLLVLMGFGVVNIIFAVYVQCKVWSAITSDEHKEEIDEYTAQVNQASKGGGYLAGAKGLLNDAKAKAQGNQAEEAPADVPAQEGKRIVPAKVVQDCFKKVFYEDLFVLAMFFALIGMAVLAGMGPATLDGEAKADNKVCAVEPDVKSCGYYFLAVAFLWSFCYMCCTCCSNKVTLAEEPKDDDM